MSWPVRTTEDCLGSAAESRAARAAVSVWRTQNHNSSDEIRSTLGERFPLPSAHSAAHSESQLSGVARNARENVAKTKRREDETSVALLKRNVPHWVNTRSVYTSTFGGVAGVLSASLPLLAQEDP
eukprot:1184421-Prorocentrum_minimum.AAC.2